MITAEQGRGSQEGGGKKQLMVSEDTSCHPGACHLIIKLCLEVYSKVIVGVIQSILTPNICF